jgi:3-methyladenine DNA glycosylase/8-oxoguanine DNA glycosylase
LARAVSEGRTNFDSIANIEDFQSRLRELPGIGNWTAQYIAMRALGDPDAFPAGDLALLRSASVRSERELTLRAETWRPWRAYAAMYLWQSDGQIKEHEEISKRPVPRSRAIAQSGRAKRLIA